MKQWQLLFRLYFNRYNKGSKQCLTPSLRRISFSSYLVVSMRGDELHD
ncbi:hypothetical protein ERO13_A01G149618v2 [Gossypium hirsutum]|nr:hypothetical protein ERO13_A01G149618v2 [Gossypium hirsutum]